MRVFEVFGLAGLVAAAPSAKKPKSFLKELGNSTWVLGNDIWNVTQNRQYANQLWFGGKDRVGGAVGHYVSYSTCPLSK
jgi:rhamnogalacturonan endolyase